MPWTILQQNYNIMTLKTLPSCFLEIHYSMQMTTHTKKGVWRIDELY